MRILFINPVATLGGAERVLLQMLSAVTKIPGIEASLLVLEDGALLDESRRLGVPATVLDMPPVLSAWGDSEWHTHGRFGKIAAFIDKGARTAPKLYSYLRALRGCARRLRPDIIHSNGIKTHLLACLAKPARVPVIWHIHDFYSLRALTARLLRGVRRRARAAVAISQAVATDVHHCFPGLPTVVIRNTVDCEKFSPGPGCGELLDRLSGLPTLPAGGFRVGLVATYALWKGHEVFLQAAAEVKRRYPGQPIRWYIVGGPIYRTRAQFTLEALREIAGRLGVLDEVGFVPFQAEPTFVYRSLDVFVHASRQAEPFGLTIAEAMACGRPVIVSQAGGAAELFDPGVEAIGVPPGDVARLARAVVELRNDDTLRLRLATAARQRALKDFHPVRLPGELSALYRRYAIGKTC
jgi:glycosyltransferase involved in cell wall biosynthesis